MKNPSFTYRNRSAVWSAPLASLVALASASAGAAPLNMPVNPLFVSTSVNPNVMMLVDNSGSMDNIIWDSGFDPTNTYPTYGSWSSTDGNVYYSDLSQGGCNSNYRQGRRNNDSGNPRRCLRLPTPRGNDTRFNGNYLNYLFHTYGVNNQNIDIRTTIPDQIRMEVAKQVATDIVTANPDVRFGIASYNPPSRSNHGGIINASCGATQSSLLSAISGLSASTNTPVAETYYEITRYFRGMSSYYNSGTYTAPLQYRCQKNFVIAVTDGFPTYDGSFPSNDADDTANTSAALPNWDGLAPNTTASMYPNFPRFSDGTTGQDQQPEGASLYLDDLAKFGAEIDIKKSGTDLAGGSYEDPEFDPQSLVTYTVGFALNNQMLEDAADYGQGEYYTASNAADLTTALQAALTDIAARAGSFSSASLNSTSLNAGSRLFQASFNSANWTGKLSATPISTGAGGACPLVAVGRLCSQAWEASTILSGQNWSTGRTIITTNNGTGAGVPFRWSNLASSQQQLLRLSSETNNTKAQQRLDYLRGDRSRESATEYRVRGSVLGDIVNSDPFFVGAPTAALPFKGYSSFRAANSARTPIVYVGANDGMLHGFRVSDGAEVLAYVPNMMFGTSGNRKLANLTANPYTHVWGVNGSPNVADVDLSPPPNTTPNWKSLLVSGMGYGGQGIFTLDVTNPASFSEANASSIVKWEFTDAHDRDVGYTMSQPSIVKMQNGKWAAIFGNGYNSGESDGNASSTEQAALFIVFLDSPGGTWTAGTHYVKFLVGPTGQDNGMAGAAAVDLDGDSLVDYIYAGDLRGNMWQFNVNSTNVADWRVGYSGSALFTARDHAGVAQPITAPPEVGFNLLTPDKDDLVVYVGTGRYLASGDNTRAGQQNQTFYGIFADPIATPGVPPTETATSPNPGRANLLEQFVRQEVTLPDGQRGRITTKNTLNLGTHKGWYIDLYNNNNGSVSDAAAAGGQNLGERQISRPLLRSGRIVFTTLVPSDDVCDPDGSGWLMELDARDGGQPRAPTLDINNNLIVDDNDIYNDNNTDDPGDDTNISGIGSPQGILSTPAVLYVGRDDIDEVKYSTRSDGSTAVFGEAASGRIGRVTWREIAP